MSDGYVKLFQSILNSSLMHLDSDTFKVFIVLLAMADADGIVRASVLAVSDRSKVDLRATERALNVFQEPDPYSTNPANEGRRVMRVKEGWLILNHQEYRERKPRSQQLANARVAKYREKKKAEQATTHETIETPVAILDELQRSATLCNALKRSATIDTAEAEAEAEADREAEACKQACSMPLAQQQRAVVDAWNVAADSRPGWRRCSKVPMGEVGRLLTARCRDPDWFRDFPRALALMVGLKWMTAAKVETFLRPDTMRKLFDEEWTNDRQANDLFVNTDPSAGVF